MATKSKLLHYLDLGDLSECHDAEIHFDWYIAPRQREDDYDELTINEVWVELGGHKINVVDLLSESKIEELETICWEWVELENEDL